MATAADLAPAVEAALDRNARSTYSHVEVRRHSNADLGPSREYNIDLAPKVRFDAKYLVTQSLPLLRCWFMYTETVNVYVGFLLTLLMLWVVLGLF